MKLNWKCSDWCYWLFSHILVFNAQVLGTRRLMHIAFDEFEKVMSQCFDVFITWDDEYEKLQGLLR